MASQNDRRGDLAPPFGESDTHGSPRSRTPDEVVTPILNIIRKHPVLSSTEQRRLISCAQQGDEQAKSLLVVHNMGLVMKWAGFYRYSGVDILDLIQEGTLGLLRAIEKFDPMADNTFATYAIHWIKAKMRRVIHNDGRTIRVPVGRAWKARQRTKRIECLRQLLLREPTLDEVAEYLVVSHRRLVEDRLCLETLESLQYRTKSLRNGRFDQPEELQDIIPATDEVSINPQLLHLARATATNIRTDLQNRYRILRRWSERDRRIIVQRYGFVGQDPWSYELIGSQIGMPRQRVHQIVFRGAGMMLRRSMTEKESDAWIQSRMDQLRQLAEFLTVEDVTVISSTNGCTPNDV